MFSHLLMSMHPWIKPTHSILLFFFCNPNSLYSTTKKKDIKWNHYLGHLFEHPSPPAPARFIESLNGPNVTRPGLFRINFLYIYCSPRETRQDPTQIFYVPKKKDPKRRRISHEVSRLPSSSRVYFTRLPKISPSTQSSIFVIHLE